MEHIEVIEIRVSARPGASINNCLKDSIKLAATEWRNVRLRFNDDQFIINVNSLLDTCIYPIPPKENEE